MLPERGASPRAPGPALVPAARGRSSVSCSVGFLGRGSEPGGRGERQRAGRLGVAVPPLGLGVADHIKGQVGRDAPRPGQKAAHARAAHELVTKNRAVVNPPEARQRLPRVLKRTDLPARLGERPLDGLEPVVDCRNHQSLGTQRARLLSLHPSLVLKPRLELVTMRPSRG